MTVKKSLYIFLCSILGMLLFLILHQIVAFAYLMLLYANFPAFSMGMSFVDFAAIDYFTLIIVLMFGAWYGIWLGLYWYGLVYENKGHGFVGHMVAHYWPNKTKPYNLKTKLAAVESKLEGELMELESLGHKIEVRAPKKRVVRRKV